VYFIVLRKLDVYTRLLITLKTLCTIHTNYKTNFYSIDSLYNTLQKYIFNIFPRFITAKIETKIKRGSKLMKYPLD